MLSWIEVRVLSNLRLYLDLLFNAYLPQGSRSLVIQISIFSNCITGSVCIKCTASFEWKSSCELRVSVGCGQGPTTPSNLRAGCILSAFKNPWFHGLVG